MVGDVVDAVVEVVWRERGLVQARRAGALGVAAGPLHDERRCGHHGPCAACPLHGVDASFVAALKAERVRQAFADVGLAVAVAPVVRGEGLRQKVKLVAYGAPGRIRLGHYVPHTHEPAPALLCGVVRPALVAALTALCARLDAQRLGPGGPGAVHAVIAREFVEGVGVVVVGDGDGAGVDVFGLLGDGVVGAAWRQASAASSANSLVSGSITRSAGVQRGTPLDGGAPCAVDAFCQADVVGAARLVDRAADHVVGRAPLDATVDVNNVDNDDNVDDIYADLYAGTGAFARALVARGAAAVVAVEVADVSVAALATLPRVQAIAGTVRDALPAVRARLSGRTFAGVVVDPPQKGLGADASAVAALGALRVAVVSCDVDRGAVDVKAFVDAGYVVDAVVPVDLFPGSAEVEVLTLLRRTPVP